MLAVIIEEERLRATFPFVVQARGRSVHVPPVRLRLRVLRRVTVNLGGRRLEDAHLEALGQPEHVDRAVHAGLRRLHRVELVMDGERARQVVDPVHLDVERQVMSWRMNSNCGLPTRWAMFCRRR